MVRIFRLYSNHFPVIFASKVLPLSLFSTQLPQASTGDAPACSGVDCFLQDIRLEAITQPGELFYDEEWGWGLLEFIQAEDDEMTRLEIGERIKEKLRDGKDFVQYLFINQ